MLEVDPAERAVRLRGRAAGPLEGVAVGADGSLYVVEDQTRVVQLAADGSRRVLADGLNGVDGILATADGIVVCESYAGNVRIVTEAGMRTIAAGLGNPSYAVEAPGGGLYVTEFMAGRVAHVDRMGGVRQIAPIRSPGPISLDRSNRLLVGALHGRIYRVDPATRRIERLWPRP